MPHDYAEWITVLAAIGQTVFIGLWARLPWWREVIGVAMFVKSLSLMLLLDTAVLYLYLPRLLNVGVTHLLQLMLLIGIWGQVGGLVYERARARQRRLAARQGVPPPEDD